MNKQGQPGLDRLPILIKFVDKRWSDKLPLVDFSLDRADPSEKPVFSELWKNPLFQEAVDIVALSNAQINAQKTGEQRDIDDALACAEKMGGRQLRALYEAGLTEKMDISAINEPISERVLTIIGAVPSFRQLYAVLHGVRGKKLYEKGEYELAISEGDKALEYWPELEAVYKYRGQAKFMMSAALLQMGLDSRAYRMDEEAVKDLSVAIESGDVELYAYRAAAYMGLGYLEEDKEKKRKYFHLAISDMREKLKVMEQDAEDKLELAQHYTGLMHIMHMLSEIEERPKRIELLKDIFEYAKLALLFDPENKDAEEFKRVAKSDLKMLRAW